jgi:2-haloacid dehalogenase
VFDIGGVLLDWNPEYLYSNMITDLEKRSYFLRHVCSPQWNLEQDRGRNWDEAVEALLPDFPEWESEIRAFRMRWSEMVEGPVPGGFELMDDLRQSGYHITALSNWSSDTFDEISDRYPALKTFSGATVSGKVGLIKPDLKIYELHQNAYRIDPNETVFIDDNIDNVKAAQVQGWKAVHHTDAENTKDALRRLGVR